MVLRKSALFPLAVLRAAGGVQEKGATGGRVLGAGGVATEGAKSAGRVEVAGCVANEGGKTDGRVAGTRGEGEKRIITLCGIATRVASVRCWDDGLHHWRQRKADDCDENKHASGKQGAN